MTTTTCAYEQIPYMCAQYTCINIDILIIPEKKSSFDEPAKHRLYPILFSLVLAFGGSSDEESGVEQYKSPLKEVPRLLYFWRK